MKQKYLSSGIQKKYLKSTLILLLLALLLSMIGVWSYMHHTLKNNIIEKNFNKTLKITYLGQISEYKGFFRLKDVLDEIYLEGYDDFIRNRKK